MIDLYEHRLNLALDELCLIKKCNHNADSITDSILRVVHANELVRNWGGDCLTDEELEPYF